MSFFRPFLLSLAALCLLLAACSNQPEAKIGIVDLEGVQTHSESIKAMDAYLNSVREGLMAEGMAAEEAYKADESEANEKALQEAMARYQEVMAAEQQRLSEQLTGVLRETFDSFREENGYAALVFKDAVLTYDPDLDVTEALAAALDARGIEVPEAPKPEAPLEEQGADQAEEPAQ